MTNLRRVLLAPICLVWGHELPAWAMPTLEEIILADPQLNTLSAAARDADACNRQGGQ